MSVTSFNLEPNIIGGFIFKSNCWQHHKIKITLSYQYLSGSEQIKIGFIYTLFGSVYKVYRKSW